MSETASGPAASGPAISSFRRRYGASPWQLITNLAVFGLAVYAFSRIFAGGQVINYLTWFLAAAILHDLVLLPLYVSLDRVFGTALAPIGPRPLINHVRVPALFSGLLALVYFPLIFSLSRHTYTNASGHPPEGYLRNWLLITATLFLGSAVVYAVRLARCA